MIYLFVSVVWSLQKSMEILNIRYRRILVGTVGTCDYKCRDAFSGHFLALACFFGFQKSYLKDAIADEVMIFSLDTY